LTTQTSADVLLGGTVSDTATLAGGNSPTGTITFALYGPDSDCSGAAVFSATVTVNDNGVYPSGPFTPTAPGLYHWVATYNGDSNNNVVAGSCGAANENVLVGKSAFFYTISPCRVLDTRQSGPALQVGAPRSIQVVGNCGIPAGASAVAFNVTTTGSTADGAVELYRGDEPPTGIPTLAFFAGQTRANNEVVQLGIGVVGASLVSSTPGATVQVILDVDGYFVYTP
jgi:hypothetical protein